MTSRPSSRKVRINCSCLIASLISSVVIIYFTMFPSLILFAYLPLFLFFSLPLVFLSSSPPLPFFIHNTHCHALLLIQAVDKKIIKEGPTSLNISVANNTASDGDLGLNGTIKYRIEDGNSEVS